MKRVVVTGLGMVTPLGLGVEPTWSALCAGRSGVGQITKFDAAKFPVRFAAEVRGFDPTAYIPPKEVKKMDTFIQYAVAAASMAVEDAGLKLPAVRPERVGVYVGSGIGGLGSIEHWHSVLIDKGPQRVTPFFIPMSIINLASGQIAIRFGAKGPNSCAVSACATGNHCIGDAYRIIQRGDADVMMAGGSEAAVTPLGVAGFAASRALSTRNNDPTRASRPFDRDRDGFVLGEGSGVVVLESLDHARERGARIYAELVGYAMNADAYHITAPSEGGEGAARCIRLALDDAQLAPERIQYINAHATSTSADALETAALKSVFGKAAYAIPISSTKSMTGHLLGAAGGVEAIFTILAMVRGVMPPTINYEHPDPACDLDYIPNTARPGRIDTALSNSFGFGGTNACLIFRRYDAAA